MLVSGWPCFLLRVLFLWSATFAACTGLEPIPVAVFFGLVRLIFAPFPKGLQSVSLSYPASVICLRPFERFAAELAQRSPPKSASSLRRLPVRFKFARMFFRDCPDRSEPALFSGSARSSAGQAGFRSREAVHAGSLGITALLGCACAGRLAWSGQPVVARCPCPAGRSSWFATAGYHT